MEKICELLYEMEIHPIHEAGIMRFLDIYKKEEVIENYGYLIIGGLALIFGGYAVSLLIGYNGSIVCFLSFFCGIILLYF